MSHIKPDQRGMRDMALLYVGAVLMRGVPFSGALGHIASRYCQRPATACEGTGAAATECVSSSVTVTQCVVTLGSYFPIR